MPADTCMHEGRLATMEAALNRLDNFESKLDLILSKVNRVEVLETNHGHHNAAIERAFAAVKKQEDALAAHIAAQAAKNSSYDRYIYMAIGFIAAVSMFWTIFGVRMMGQMDEFSKSMQRAEVHISQDKIMSHEDVQKSGAPK